MPHLTDSRSRVAIGAARTPADTVLVGAGATSVLYSVSGQRVGVYVDNETPGRDAVARDMVSRLPGELIAVGLYPNENGHRIAGCVCALEWFALWGSPPAADAFILWWDYVPDGEHKPTLAMRSRMLVSMLNRNPRFAWVY